MNNSNKCPIWGKKATYQYLEKSKKWQFESLRAGGKFIVSGRTKRLLRSISDEAKARLTDWLLEQRELGIEVPDITQEQVERAKTAPPSSVSVIADRLLKHLEKNSDLPGISTAIKPENLSMSHEYLLAIIGSTNPAELSESAHALGQESWRPELNLYFNYLEKKGWISRPTKDEYIQVTVEFEGYAHLESLQTRTDSKQAFVAMWFDDSMDDAYDNGIYPAIKGAGYEPLRIKDIEFNNEIIDMIIAQIRRSRFLVADFTHDEEGQRGGVYFEAGLAKRMGLDVIYTCREDLRDKIHFDTQQFNHIFWNSSDDLKMKLKNRMEATIG